ncbi:hypothetical protein ACFX13_036445 [Malus domestica]
MPELIEIKKVLIKDERTSCLKPDLLVTINADALEGDGKSKPVGGGSMHLRKAFHKRFADLSKSHPEDYEIPEETLLQPFGPTKQDMQSDTDKLPLSSSQVGCSFSKTASFLLLYMELSYPRTYILSTPCFVCIYTVPFCCSLHAGHVAIV